MDDNTSGEALTEEQQPAQQTEPVVKQMTFPELPDELLEETREAFALFSDDDGRMNVRHLYTALRSMDVDAGDDDVIAVVDEHDPEGIGYITVDQWTAAMVRRWTDDRERVKLFRARLATGDHANTGKVTVEHLRSVLTTFNPKALTNVDVEEMVSDANYAGLGFVDVDEFMATMVRRSRLDQYTS